MKVKMTKQDIAERLIESDNKTRRFYQLKIVFTFFLSMASLFILIVKENDMWPFAMFLLMFLFNFVSIDTEMEYRRNQKTAEIQLSLYSGADEE